MGSDENQTRAPSLVASADEAMAAAGLLFWRWDIDSGELLWSIPGGDGVTRRMPVEDFFDSVHPDDRDRVRLVLDDVVANYRDYLKPASVLFEHRVALESGAVRWTSSRGCVTSDDGVRALQVTGACADTTSLHDGHNSTGRRRAELAEKRGEVRKDEALARLSANAARDFDNLLTVILGSVELASGDDIPEITRHLLETIRTTAEQAGELTRGMLLYGQRIAGRPQVVAVENVLDEAAPMLGQGLGRQHALTIEVQQKGLYVRIDPAQLKLTLLHLIVNARHAMPTGGEVSIEVSRTTFDDDGPGVLEPNDYVVIAVRDNGVGISEEALPHLFEPFYTTRVATAGAGMGLAACRGIVRKAGGTIIAQNDLDAGATFRIFLPVQPAPSEATAPPTSTPQTHTPPTVLYVDDDPLLQRVFRAAVGQKGFEVDTCGSAEEALERLSAETYDIVVSDVIMLGMSGLELATIVRERWPDLPLVLLSGRHHDVQDGTPILLKPIDALALATKLRELLAAD